MRLSFILAAIVAMGLAGCNHAEPTGLPGVAAAVATAPGTGVIRGRGLVRMPAGELLTCAGFGMLAVPSRKETWTIAQRIPLDQFLVGDELARLATALGGEKTKCNADGRFVLANLKPGQWIVVTPVFWRLAGAIGGHAMTGGGTVESGKETAILINDSLEIHRCPAGYCVY
jgi:hypothetical protein